MREVKLPVLPHTVVHVSREAHGIFLATLATGVVWRVTRDELMSMDQGSAKLITLELREMKAASSRTSMAEPGFNDPISTDFVGDDMDFIDDFVYHPAGECPSAPEGDVVQKPIDANVEDITDGGDIISKKNDEPNYDDIIDNFVEYSIWEFQPEAPAPMSSPEVDPVQKKSDEPNFDDIIDNFVEYSVNECPPSPSPYVDPTHNDYSGVDILAQFHRPPIDDPHDFMKNFVRKAQGGDTESESSDNVTPNDSDEEDMSEAEEDLLQQEFGLETKMTWCTLEDEHINAIEALAEVLRQRPLAPPSPEDPSTHFANCKSGISFPACHCAFKDCDWTSGRMPRVHRSETSSMWLGDEGMWRCSERCQVLPNGCVACC